MCFACSRNFFDVISTGPFKGFTLYKVKFKHDFNCKKVRFCQTIEFLHSQTDLLLLRFGKVCLYAMCWPLAHCARWQFHKFKQLERPTLGLHANPSPIVCER